MKSIKWILGILIVLIAILLGFSQGGKSKYTPFAQCIEKSGAKFYGAFWCPHCQRQKAMFGSAKKYLPYVECSTRDGNGRTQVCIDNKIEGYPTWVFADGSRLSGEIELETLAEKTSCVLPVK